MGNYWDQYDETDPMFWHGVAAGIRAYAYWKDGKQYVGTTGKTLKEALKEIESKQYEAAKARARKKLYENDHSGVSRGDRVHLQEYEAAKARARKENDNEG